MKDSTDAAIRRNPGNSGMSEFIVNDWNVQIDPDEVRVGDILLIAEKSSVRAGSHPQRLIAAYADIQVVQPRMCEVEGERHSMSVCTQCIRGSWLWDYFFRNVRTLRNFAHATARAYDYFGCRCARCIEAHQVYLGARYLGDTHTVPYATQIPRPVPRLGSK